MGFKKTSETIAISIGLDESAANTFTEEQINLQLDILNNEIFVVLAVDLNLTAPDSVPAINTSTAGSMTSTTVASMPTLANTNCVAVSRDFIRMAVGAVTGVGFSRNASETYTGDLDYIALIATNNFFIQVQGVNNLIAKSVNGRIWGYRARADSDTYAALVQSEVLSA